jgi:hypothetical protein
MFELELSYWHTGAVPARGWASEVAERLEVWLDFTAVRSEFAFFSVEGGGVFCVPAASLAVRTLGLARGSGRPVTGGAWWDGD